MKKNLENLEILDEQITHKYGCFEKGKRWVKGKHPDLGVLVQGITGCETLIEFSRIKPIVIYEVSQ